MKERSKPYAILVFGAPMSGKTSFAEQFSARFNMPFINLSELHDTYRVSRKVGLILVSQIAKCKHNLIIEGCLDTERQRNEMRDLLVKAGYIPQLIWIQTDLNAIKQRMRKKYDKLDDAKKALNESYSKIEAPADYENPLVISGKHMFQTQCRNVIRGLSERSKAQKK